MGNGCCCTKNTRVAPVSAPVAPITEVTIPQAVKKEKPYGFLRLYAGSKTGESKHTSPVISLHTYYSSRRVTVREQAALVASNGQAGQSATQQGPSNTTSIDRREIEERVRCIPVENIISIEYSTDVKKEHERHDTVRERPRTPPPKLSCCGRIKKSLRETFCCCPSCPCKVCQSEAPNVPVCINHSSENVVAQRMILVSMKCVQHANIDIPSHVQILPAETRDRFYLENFNVEPIEFYLVDNHEADGSNFEARRHQAELLCRIVVQLRNMRHQYPSPKDLHEMLVQEQAAFFGDDIHE